MTDDASREREPSEVVVVGLGNPGARYEGTRHNAGADVVAELARRLGGRLRHDRKVSADLDSVRLDAGGGVSVRLHLAVPTTYMNDSGRAVAQLLARHPVDGWDRLVVVHDELDLEPGTIRVKLGGGLAGNNGLRSIAEHTHTRDWARVRVGIGKPPGGPERGADWVLSRPRGAAGEELAVSVARAADAVELLATDGAAAAMQRYNAKG